ncbi:hypothetical protein CYMTET_37646 [Cymbomonas tetramitiformis]|uniref:Uncharacterized protein n=1 Tax=Cymbomonas tetramitiformis TaxID=36881 RepID=A0AAE0CFQ1_9CHLO|nr:hypothetical protein CYMTET_37646 [Cymbomonas tetramitiformis]
MAMEPHQLAIETDEDFRIYPRQYADGEPPVERSFMERGRKPAPFSRFIQRVCANDTILHSCLYEVLNDTDLALLSLTCKHLYRSVVVYYEAQAQSEGVAFSTPQIRKRRIRVSDCLGTLELQRFYAMSVQDFLLRVGRDHQMECLSVFSCDAGRRLCTDAVRMDDLHRLRAKIWSVATGPLVDALVLCFDYRRFYRTGPRNTDVDRLMSFLRPASRYPTAALNGSDYKDFKYDSKFTSYHSWYMKWHSETQKRKVRLNFVRAFKWGDVDRSLLRYNLPWASIGASESNVCALLCTTVPDWYRSWRNAN